MTNPYIRLMRLHQPAGVWLLLFPCWWSVALASQEIPSLWLMALFSLGAVVMRGAGCIINDMADREFDKKVERTRTRPLASGELTLKEASAFLLMLLVVAFLVALQMKPQVVFWALASLPLVVSYPFMKRITWWPQAFLGLTFNWGALIGWVAVNGEIGLPAVLLYLGGVFWTLGYDTIYAHQDKVDDVHAGVKSLALRLGDATLPAVQWFYGLACMLWGGALLESMASVYAVLIAACVGAHFLWQVKTVDLGNPLSCMRVFKSNAQVGWVMLLGIVIARL